MLLLSSPGYGWLSGLQVHIAGSCWASHPPVPPSPSPQGCSRTTLCPACNSVWVCPNPRAGPCAWPCWTSCSSRRPPLSSLSRSLWMASLPSSVSATPHSLVSSANLLRVHSVPLSVSPTKTLNSASPNTDSQFLTHWMVHPSNPCLSNLETRMSCGTA